MTSPLAELVRVEDPDFYDADQYQVYDRMRVEAPAFLYKPLTVHLLTRLTDVRQVSTNPEMFSNVSGLTLNQLRLAKSGAAAAFERFNEPDGELVITKDPPRHRQLRALMSPALTPRYLAGFRDTLVGFCRQLLDPLVPGEPFDFIESVAAKLPLFVAGAILGVNELDIPRMQSWVAALEELTYVDDVAELEDSGRRFDELKDFLRAEISERRGRPGSDMISLMLNGKLDGAGVPEPVVLAHVSTLMSNGGTTRLLLGSLAGTLADNPEQLALIRDNPDLLDAAIEECLRLYPPARGFVRTVKGAIDIAGVALDVDDRVYMLYPAANRDPEHFPDPDRFDVTRPSGVSHVSFGVGNHFCLGAGLARLEARVLFGELLSRFRELRSTGSRARYRHVQLNGWATVPISVHR
jgi:cytochrome P450